MDYLVSGLEMAELDRQTIHELGVPGRVLMEVAGRAVARACLCDLPRAKSRVVIACGPGNNGGDGYVTARALAEAGHEPLVFVFAERRRITGDALAALGTLEKSANTRITFVEDARALATFATLVEGAALVVDALFGTGLSKDVRGTLGDAIDVINERAARVIAVDIPSGIHADTGAVLGRAVRATRTVTFGFAKRGHYLYPGAGQRGELTVEDIGIPEALAAKLNVLGRVIDRNDIATLTPVRAPDAHKGNFGTLLIVGGCPETPGAALLAAAGALRSGVGLVRWATDRATLATAPTRPADLMLLLRDEDESSDAFATRILTSASAVVIGPGYSTAAARLDDLGALLSQARVPLCLDADALNLLAAHPDLWALAQTPLVVTPHPKEMARLTGREVAAIQNDRFAAATELAAAHGCITVLKGAGTVIAGPDGRVAVASTGNPGLAKGGTGDVLAGLIGGLLAQGLEPVRAAELGVLVHGAAGDEAARQSGQAGLTASAVAEAIGDVWRTAKR